MNRALAPLSSSRRFLSVTWRCAATEQGAIPQGGQGVPSAASGSDTKELPQTRRKPHGSLEEALYLAKMAGIYTVDEVQYQIVKGPEFSRDDSPFMLENFLEVEPEEGDYDKLQEGEAGSESTGSNSDDGNKNNVNRMIHAAFERYGKPDMPAKFWHKDEEWLSRCEGRGTRKRAAAHALLVRGTGIFRVNGNEDMYARWPQIYNRIDVCQPFKLTGTAGLYDVFVAVRGGGWSGQAGATRLAIARALFQANPACHDRLQEGFCLLEDTRQKMSSMAGRPGSQSNYAWNKR